MAEKSLNECPDYGPFEKSMNIDSPSPYCGCNKNGCNICNTPSQKDVPFFESITRQKIGIGQSAQCDPIQAGHITQDMSKDPDRNTIYRYSKGIRGCDEAVKDLFSDAIVIDEQGTAFPVPIMWGSQERAVAAVIQTNVRKDNSLVVDRVRLPLIAIYSSDFTFNQERYTYHRALNYFRNLKGRPGLTIQEKRPNDTILGLSRGIPIDIGYQMTVWTKYIEDMNQIVEQILQKFSPIAYIRIQGVHWETVVKLESIGNNLDTEPGDTAERIIKFQFNMTAETYLPQPITRKKAILSERIEIANDTDEKKIVEILARLEIDSK